MRIPDRLLLATCAWSDELPATRVAAAIARGVRTGGTRAGGTRAGGMVAPEECPIEDGPPADFDDRMKLARAVIVGAGRLSRETLRDSPAFEIATRARQAGVPAYAVTAVDELSLFDARMLDLQVVLQAGDAQALRAVGRRLAELA